MANKKKLCHCGRPGYFGFNSNEDLVCSQHRMPGMCEQVRTKCKKCCSTATYRSDSKGKLDTCKNCKTPTSKANYHCKEDNCFNVANHGYGRKATLCDIHASMSMPRIIQHKCESCNRVGGFKSDKKYYCVKHQPFDATPIFKKCVECKTGRAVYGYDKADFCNKCRTPDIPNYYVYTKKKKLAMTSR